MSAVQFGRAVRAEIVRVGGPRSPLLYAALPGAIMLPLLVTFAVATVAERFAVLSDDIRVTSVGTENSVYWVITFTVMVWAVIAATAQASATGGPASEVARFLFPRTWTGVGARWLVYGCFAAATSLLLVTVVMLVLPAAFPAVYSGVDIASPAGVRFVLGVPLYAFAACGAGVALGALIGHPVVTAAALFGWVFVVENAIALVPDGYTLQGYMPFLNGQFGTGQQLAFTPPWGPTGALAYLFAVTVGLFALAWASLAWRARPGRVRPARVRAPARR